MFIYLLQLKVYFQSLHNVFELIIPNSLFLKDVSLKHLSQSQLEAKNLN